MTDYGLSHVGEERERERLALLERLSRSTRSRRQRSCVHAVAGSRRMGDSRRRARRTRPEHSPL